MHQDELMAAIAFNKQSHVFDEQYGSDSLICYKRKRVRAFVETHIAPASRILELNAGTGEDALYFARQGHMVHATDISVGMLNALDQKASLQASLAITSEHCSFTQLDNLSAKGPYDLIFSNFAGLNCCAKPAVVFSQFDKLLKPGGKAILVMLPTFCLWETMLLFKGKWKTAFRRLLNRKSFNAKVEGQMINCYYHKPSRVKRSMPPGFTCTGIEGLCTIVPPSYIQGFAEKYPATFNILSAAEARLCKTWPFDRIGDYYIICFQKDEA
jgi:ubiquinone/menaquinone biosynthesis C-methylase UbiE